LTFCDNLHTMFAMAITITGHRDSMVRVGVLGRIPSVLHTLETDPGPIFEDVGFTLEEFKDADRQISYLRAGRLLARCVEDSGCQHFGLLLGQSSSPSLLGVPGFMVHSAPNVARALDDLLYNLDLHDHGGSPTLDSSNGVTVFGYTIHQPGVKAAEQIYDLSIAVVYNIMRTLCGSSWAPLEIMLARKKPRDVWPYRRFFKAPIRFDAAQSAVAFSSRWLKYEAPSADEFLHDHLEKEARVLHQLQHRELLDRLHEVLHLGILNRRFSVQEISAKFKINERTLHRRLKAAGTSFRHELDGARQALALQLLSNTDLSIMEISDVLAYKGPSSFIRAFKRWNDVSPQTWRLSHKPE